MIVLGAEVILLKNGHNIMTRSEPVSSVQMISKQGRFRADN